MNPDDAQTGQYPLPVNSFHGNQGYHNGYQVQPVYHGYPPDVNGYNVQGYYGNPHLVQNFPSQVYYYDNQPVPQEYHHGYQYGPVPGQNYSYRPRGGRGQRSRYGQSHVQYPTNNPPTNAALSDDRSFTSENDSFVSETQTSRKGRDGTNNYSSRHEMHHKLAKQQSSGGHEANIGSEPSNTQSAGTEQAGRPDRGPHKQPGDQSNSRYRDARRSTNQNERSVNQNQRPVNQKPPNHNQRPPNHNQRPPNQNQGPVSQNQRPPNQNQRPPNHNQGPVNQNQKRGAAYTSRGRVDAGRSQDWRKTYHTFKHGTQEDIETQRGSLIEQLGNHSYECMICCDIVLRDSAVWSCTNCYHIYHLHCVKKWAQSSTTVEEGSSGWRCPACQNITQQYPTQYKCFCGSVRNPDVRRHEVPHSCGEVCRKKRSADCTHPCNILCHPGPCPPCHASIIKHCDCGRTKQTVKCSQATSLKCTETCLKTLNCGRHECQNVCHAAPCQPCQDHVTQVCYCGKDTRSILCGSSESFTSSYSCKLICDRQLACEKHNCDKTCHPGECDECALLPEGVTHCPCGKTRLEDIPGVCAPRTTCTDPIPTCTTICAKKLPCGNKGECHTCQLVCHTGPCGPCDGSSDVICRCGRFTKQIPCVEAALYNEENPFLCEKKCTKKRHCLKHKCGQFCCVDDEHKCTVVCKRKLTCGLHKCTEPCHRNNCATCWRVSFDELHCHCGIEVMYPPIPCGTQPPECQQPCTRQHPCDHPVLHTCHSEEECPSCVHLTEKWCYGRHEKRRNIPCHRQDVSCGMPCNKPLPCGIHLCQTMCHKGECVQSGDACTQPCPQQRTGCPHPCAAPCHSTEPCPQTACRAELVIRCECGNRTEKAPCLVGSDKTSEFLKMETSMLALTVSNAQDGQSVDLSAMMKEANKRKPRKLECNTECSVRERNKRLALALEINNPDISSKLGNPTYTTFLKDYARQNTGFVASVEQEFSKLVNMAQKSKQVKRSHAFKPMNGNQRRLVHELGDFYGCETQSYDMEPNKNVVATAHKGKCLLPNLTLTQLTQRDLHTKAPLPIPHNSKQSDMRSSVSETNKSAAVPGAWGKLTTAASAQPSKPSPWSSLAPPGSTKSAATTQPRELKSLSVLRKQTPPTGTGRCSPVIDYFDMS